MNFMLLKKLNYKYYLIIMIIYSFLLSLTICCTFPRLDRYYNHYKTIKNSSYEYVYTVSNTTQKDDYLNCSSINFYTDTNMYNSLFCDCFMTLNSTEYTLDSPVKTRKKLGARDAAISYNLAKQHNLDIGSTIYSNHNIINSKVEYTIVEILPICYGIMYLDFEINHGIIVIGNDDEYIKRTNYSYVGFSKDDPTVMIQNNGVLLFSLDFVDVKEQVNIIQLIAQQMTIILLVGFLTVSYNLIHFKNQCKYYKRLLILGAPTKKINIRIQLDITVPWIIIIIMSCFISLFFLKMYNFYYTYISLMISILFSILILIISLIFVKKWR